MENSCSVWAGSAADGGAKGLFLHLPNDLVITSYLSAISTVIELGRICLGSGLVKTLFSWKRNSKSLAAMCGNRSGLEKCLVSWHLPAQLNLQDVSSQHHFGGLEREREVLLLGLALGAAFPHVQSHTPAMKTGSFIQMSDKPQLLLCHFKQNSGYKDWSAAF